MRSVYFLIACTIGMASPALLYAQGAWKLVWSDEFNYTGAPDSIKWIFDEGGNGWGNNEKQFYTCHPQNCHVEQGRLMIDVMKEQYKGTGYTSARLVTKGKAGWTHGKIEVSAKLPSGRGTWPAIWLLSAHQPLKWPDDGEIDIMEHVGYDQGNVHGTIHCARYNSMRNNQKSAIVTLPDCSATFHIYSVEWDKELVNIFVDGRKYFSYPNEHTGSDAWPFDQPLYLILNVAVGGNWGGLKGIDDSIFPQRMEVNYVRVYERATN